MSDHSMRFAVVIEDAGSIFSAYVPDLPGCVAVGSSIKETETHIRKAIEFHLESMRADNHAIPTPTSHVEYVEAGR